MPNRKRSSKGRSVDRKSIALHTTGYDESPYDDAGSETSSNFSACSEPTSERSAGSHGFDVDEQQEGSMSKNNESRMKNAIEGLYEKNAKRRQDCLKILIKCFSTSDLSDILDDYRDTLSSCLEKCIKKGKSEEQCLAASVIAILCVQIGSNEDIECMLAGSKSVLVSILVDESVSVLVRSKCCEALGVYYFITASETPDLLHTMFLLESIFSGSYFKGDNTLPVVSPAVAEFHNNALLAWGLLLTVCDRSCLLDLIVKLFPQFPALLQSSSVCLRITAGETLALVYEILYEEDKLEIVTGLIDEQELCERLKALATDGNKFRAKKERRQQRSSFREVLQTVEKGALPEDLVKFGTETLSISSWTVKRRYRALKSILGTGMNFHLNSSALLREVFELGPPVVSFRCSKSSSSSHFERHLRNQAQLKARTKSRGKLRDKRSSFYVNQ